MLQSAVVGDTIVGHAPLDVKIPQDSRTHPAATDQVLDGVSKNSIADSVYDVLPDYIGKFPIVVVKRFVSRERFAELVQLAYDKFDENLRMAGRPGPKVREMEDVCGGLARSRGLGRLGD